MNMDPKLREQINEALLHAGATHTFRDVMMAVQTGAAQAWGSDRTALVTEVLNYPQRRVMRLWLAAGDMQEVLDLAGGPVLAFARECGCDSAELMGRAGWDRLLLPMGWRKVATVLRKELRA